MLTTDQIRNRTKTVTRRLGWLKLKVGDKLQGCVKCMGLKPGEKIQKLASIEVVSIRREELCKMMDDDCAREGFPEMDSEQFIEMFCSHMKANRLTEVTRIEFKYIDA